MKKLLIVNNIPTPYRSFMFDKMIDIGYFHGFEVDVIYQNMIEERRSWVPDNIPSKHKYIYSKGVLGRGRKSYSYWQVNLDILKLSRSCKYDYILFAPLLSLNGWLTALLTSPYKQLHWIESNLQSVKVNSGIGYYIKKKILSKAYRYLVPGNNSKKYCDFFLPGIEENKYLNFPNLIDIDAYRGNVLASKKNQDTRLKYDLTDNVRIFISVGEVTERKGIDKLISSLKTVEGEFVHLVVGGGPELDFYKSEAERTGISHRLKFLGWLEPNEIQELLQVSDCFVHAARRDPSPLVCIEAIASGLPIIVSKQTGNSLEVCNHGKNGHIFDLEIPGDFSRAINKFINMSQDDLSLFSVNSQQWANDKFSPDTVLSDFFSSL